MQKTFVESLADELSEIEAEMLDILDKSKVRWVDYNDDDSAVIVLVPAHWTWAEDAPEVVERRRLLYERYRRWLQRFRMLFGTSIPSIVELIDGVDGFIASWLERSGSWTDGIPGTMEEAKRIASGRIAELHVLLEQISENTENGSVLVVDTNALLDCPDLGRYAEIDPNGCLAFVPEVLRELDDQKSRGRNEHVREAATKAIRRIKGLRDRGSLTSGVTVEGKVTAQAIGTEPNFDTMPDWLDASTPDDRMIAAALQLQVAEPRRVVRLVTSDVSAQIKAEVAGLPYVEPPD